MVSVERFIHDEPALFAATAEFVRLFARVGDPVLKVACQGEDAQARIAWTLLGTALFQDINYPEFTLLLQSLYERFPDEKLWTLPVPKASDIESCVEEVLGCRNWSMFENVAGIFWSVGHFVRRHGNLQEWLRNCTPEEIWRDLGEIYFMGKGNPRPKACAAIYRMTAPLPVGLGMECAASRKKWPPLPLSMGARRYLSILGPASDGFAELEPSQKQRLATDLYVAIARLLVEQVKRQKAGNATDIEVDASVAYVAAHSLQFYLEDGTDGFICRYATEHCRKCPLREYCSYAE